MLRMLVVKIAGAVDAIDGARNYAYIAFMVGVGGVGGLGRRRTSFRLVSAALSSGFSSGLLSDFFSFAAPLFLALLGQIFRRRVTGEGDHFAIGRPNRSARAARQVSDLP